MDEWYIGAHKSSLEAWYTVPIGHRYTWKGKPFPTAPGNVRSPAGGKTPALGEPGGTPATETLIPTPNPHNEKVKDRKAKAAQKAKETKGKSESVVTKLAHGVNAVSNGVANAWAEMPGSTKKAAAVLTGVAVAAATALNPANA